MPKRSPVRKPVRKKKGGKKKAKAQPRKLTTKQLLATFKKDVADDIAKINTLMDLDCVAHVRRWVSTGCLELDRALTPPALLSDGKVGGIPCGRVAEVFGPAHIGKSTLLDHIFVSVQNSDGVGILLETDAGRDANYTGRIGVDMDALQYFEFAEDQTSIENVSDKAIQSIRWWKANSPETPVVVGFDALGVTPTTEEIKKKVSESTTASAAKVLRKMCRKIASVIVGTNISLIVLNHEYKVISFGAGVKSSKTYGGDALPLLSAVRLKLHPVKDGWVKRSVDGAVLGRKVGYEVVKFKLGDAYKRGEFALLNGRGIDNVWTLWDTLVRGGVITVGGSWGAVNIDDEVTKFQGWMGLRAKCQESPEFFGKLINVYYQHIRSV